MAQDFTAPVWEITKPGTRQFKKGDTVFATITVKGENHIQWSCAPDNFSHTAVSMEVAVAQCEAEFWKKAWRQLAQNAAEKEVSESFRKAYPRRSQDLEQMCRDHFNEPVLVCGKTARLVGYAEDDHDCYLILHYLNGYQQTPKTVYHSCVGGYTFLDPLKGHDIVISTEGERWDDFYRVSCFLTQNGVPEVPEFILEKYDG